MIYDSLISAYVTGIDDAMKTCSAAMDEINKALSLPYISRELADNIKTRMNLVEKLQDKIREGLEHIDRLQQEQDKKHVA